MSASSRAAAWLLSVATVVATVAIWLLTTAPQQGKWRELAGFVLLGFVGLSLLGAAFYTFRRQRDGDLRGAGATVAGSADRSIVAGSQSAGGNIYNVQGPLGSGEAKTGAKPRIVLDAFHVKEVAVLNRAGSRLPIGVLGVRFRNEPVHHEESARALRLFPEFRCEGSGLDLPWIVARADYSAEPTEMASGERPQLTVDVEIGQWLELNLVVKEQDSEDCYMFNNDSYHYPRWQNPEWRMPPGEYKVIVTLRGVRVQERLECTFNNRGQGHDLQVKHFEQLKN